MKSAFAEWPPFWTDEPSILFQNITALYPSRKQSYNENLNAISRLTIVLTLILYLTYKQSFKILATGFLTLGAVIFLHFVMNSSREMVEGFDSTSMSNSELYNLVKSNFTEPTEKNPVMNVLLTEIDDDPNRRMAAPAFHSIVEKDINESTKDMVAVNFDDPAIKDRLFKDLGDKFSFEQSMRQFYATPNTTVPNDQEGFAEYCYADMISCRDITNNELACTRNMPPQWINP
jgi:hypothetical protein